MPETIDGQLVVGFNPIAIRGNDGRSITGASINGSGHLILTWSTGPDTDVGLVAPTPIAAHSEAGTDGFVTLATDGSPIGPLGNLTHLHGNGATCFELATWTIGPDDFPGSLRFKVAGWYQAEVLYGWNDGDLTNGERIECGFIANGVDTFGTNQPRVHAQVAAGFATEFATVTVSGLPFYVDDPSAGWFQPFMTVWDSDGAPVSGIAVSCFVAVQKIA